MSGDSRLSRRLLLGGMAGGAAGMLAGARAVPAADAVAANAVAAGSVARSKGRLKQSICRWCYNNKKASRILSVDELARHAARIGYQSIELVGSEDWPTLKKYGLTCAMAIGPGSGPNRIARTLNRRETHDPCEAQLRQTIKLAAEAGFPNVICLAGQRDGLSDEEGIKNCVDGVKRVIGYAEAMKINICMEILNSKVDHKGHQFDKMAFGVAIAKQVGSPRFGILYDIYHAQIMEGDIIRTIRDHSEYILHYHTGGNPGRNEIDETQELNYAAIMKAIVETGFQGFVGQEFIPQHDPVESLERAFRICDV